MYVTVPVKCLNYGDFALFAWFTLARRNERNSSQLMCVFQVHLPVKQTSSGGATLHRWGMWRRRTAESWAPSVLEIRYGSFRKHPLQAARTLVSIVKDPRRSLHSVSLAVSVSVKGQRSGPDRRICLSHGHPAGIKLSCSLPWFIVQWRCVVAKFEYSLHFILFSNIKKNCRTVKIIENWFGTNCTKLQRVKMAIYCNGTCEYWR